MPDDTLDPALSPEQWDEFTGGNDLGAVFEWRARRVSRHGLAARSLHAQPFGFTWEDVDALRSVAELNPDFLPGYGVPIRSLADRIAALLAPRTT